MQIYDAINLTGGARTRTTRRKKKFNTRAALAAAANSSGRAKNNGKTQSYYKVRLATPKLVNINGRQFYARYKRSKRPARGQRGGINFKNLASKGAKYAQKGINVARKGCKIVDKIPDIPGQRGSGILSDILDSVGL